MVQQEWRNFNGGVWENEINVRDFIQRNYTPYEGDSSFLRLDCRHKGTVGGSVRTFETGA